MKWNRGQGSPKQVGMLQPSMHADGRTSSSAPQERFAQHAVAEIHVSLRERATRADESSTLGIDLATLWNEMTEGRYVVHDLFHTHTRHVCVLRPDHRPAKGPLPRNHLETLQSVLVAPAQKCVAIERGVAPATVALRCKAAM
ncbi:MAG TPA: hypothetical protein VGQ57_13215, partial [Polyangiaceae bacterium]|nr:hypothetical protein [Polyangiaceae bacterium]